MKETPMNFTYNLAVPMHYEVKHCVANKCDDNNQPTCLVTSVTIRELGKYKGKCSGGAQMDVSKSCMKPRTPNCVLT